MPIRISDLGADEDLGRRIHRLHVGQRAAQRLLRAGVARQKPGVQAQVGVGDVGDQHGGRSTKARNESGGRGLKKSGLAVQPKVRQIGPSGTEFRAKNARTSPLEQGVDAGFGVLAYTGVYPRRLRGAAPPTPAYTGTV